MIRRQCSSEIHVSFDKILFHLSNDSHKICTSKIEDKVIKLKSFTSKAMLYLRSSEDLDNLRTEILEDPNLFEHVKELPITYYNSKIKEVEKDALPRNRRLKKMKTTEVVLSK